MIKLTYRPILSKKMITTITILLIALFISVFLIIRFSEKVDAGKYELIIGAHRGDSVRYKENTLEAIDAAVVDDKYEFIEFDVQYTYDKNIVLYHDNELIRMYGHLKNISDVNYTDLKEYTNDEIALYSEVMDVIDNKKKLNIEIKSIKDLNLSYELVDYIVNDNIKRNNLENIMLSSVSVEVIQYINKKYPHIETGIVFWILPSTIVNFEFLTKHIYDVAEVSGAKYIMLHGSNITNIENLFLQRPKDKVLCFWYFTDEILVFTTPQNPQIW